ncbi:unnamed protein product, partial [marine sediment metagenome]
MQIPRVVVTGVGTVNPIGLNVEEFWQGLVAGKSGIGPITKFDTSNFRVKVSAEVKNFDPTMYMDLKTVDRNSRTVHLAIAAAREAIESAGLDMSQECAERVGVCVASQLDSGYKDKQIEVIEKRGPRRIDPLLVAKSSPSGAAMQVGMLLGAKGPNTSVNSLCASGTDAIGNAFNFIRLGYADLMIAGGADATISTVSIAGIDILGALSREP